MEKTQTWAGLRKAIQNLEKQRKATNLIIIIGEKAGTESGVDRGLLSKIQDLNARILGFQVYAGKGNEYNNFILDLEDMINFYSEKMIKTKGRILVSPKQIRRGNTYKPVDHQENGYMLDFPDNSITQGALFFPQKSQNIPMEMLSENIDLMLRQVKQDNDSITTYMSKAFSSVGSNRTKFYQNFLQNYGIAKNRAREKKIISSFVNEIPSWYLPSDVVLIDKTRNKSPEYKLMLSEGEMKELKDFFESLSEREVDYITSDQPRKKRNRKPCKCSDDDLFAEIEEKNRAKGEKNISNKDTAAPDGFYVNTRKIRKHLFKKHLELMTSCRLCKEKKGKLKSLSLAKAEYKITGYLSSNELLNQLKLKDIKRKKKLPDEVLEDLVNYYKKLKEELGKAEAFQSNAETYYWVVPEYFPDPSKSTPT